MSAPTYIHTHHTRRYYRDPLARATPTTPPCPVTYGFGKCAACLTHNIRDHWTHLREITCVAGKLKLCRTHFDIEMVARAAQGKPTFKWDELEPAARATEEA